MKFTPVILALPALAVAQQNPLFEQAKGLYEQASRAIFPAAASATASGVPLKPYIPEADLDPVAAAAAKAASLVVSRLTLANHNTLLQPGAATASPGIEEWMIFVTGGNKTCFGLCENADKEWNKSVALITASRNSPNLARLDCETDPVLCNAWAVGPPSVMYALLPQPLPDQSTPATTVHFINLNRTSVTASEIAAIATEKKYTETAPYEGLFHPFDGQLAKFGVNIPFGYAVFYFSLIPSWLLMVGISFFTRSFMSGRTAQAGRPRPSGPPGAGVAPAAAAQ